MSEISVYSQLLKTKKTVFNIDDLNQIWNELSRQSLSEKLNYLVKTKKLLRLKRGVYALPDREINAYELGAKAKSPSYISLFTVLADAGITFQNYNLIYLVSNNTEELSVGEYRYTYRKIKDEILFNPQGITIKDGYSIATVERAYLDTLYLYPGIGFDNEKALDKERCIELIDVYQNKRLSKELKTRLE